MAAGNDIRDQFLQAVYEQISENVQNGGVAQGSNFWNLYSVGVGSDDPYQITLADTSTMAVVSAHVSTPSLAVVNKIYVFNAFFCKCSSTLVAKDAC